VDVERVDIDHALIIGVEIDQIEAVVLLAERLSSIPNALELVADVGTADAAVVHTHENLTPARARNRTILDRDHTRRRVHRRRHQFGERFARHGIGG